MIRPMFRYSVESGIWPYLVAKRPGTLHTAYVAVSHSACDNSLNNCSLHCQLLYTIDTVYIVSHYSLSMLRHAWGVMSCLYLAVRNACSPGHTGWCIGPHGIERKAFNDLINCNNVIATCGRGWLSLTIHMAPLIKL